MLGVIAGTGFERLFKGIETHCPTPYGSALAVLDQKRGIAFVSRHGFAHAIPPHKINHRANFSAFKKLGVKEIVGISACGAISNYSIGDLVLLQDFMDFRAPPTFFDSLESLEQHAWMVPPFSKTLGERLERSAKKAGVQLKKGGVVAVTQGPRLETPAEIKAFAKLGANLVGMTTSPEAILARELGLQYAAIAVVSNYAAGLKGALAQDIGKNASAQSQKILKLLLQLPK
ncbi:MAG: MTAP family purine nucleoside phosphorylase [Candidatus Norongarragalinales archaeon]